jgi:hypothetical protein
MRGGVVISGSGAAWYVALDADAPETAAAYYATAPQAGVGPSIER